MKRIISYLLAVVLIFSICFEASAEPFGPETGQDGSYAEAEGDEFKTGEDGISPQEDEGDEQGTEEEDSDSEDDSDVESNREPGEAADSGENMFFTVNPDRTASGQETEGIPEDGQEEDGREEDAQEDDGDKKEKKRSGDLGSWGQVDVEILSALNLQKDVSFTVSLTGQEPKQVILAAEQTGENGRVSQAVATFESLEPGNYVLTVEAPGFAAFTQEIAVEDWAYNLILTTGMVSGFAYGQPGSVHPGLLLLGDVDGNGRIDDGDRDLLVDAIDAGEREPQKQEASRHENPNLDLNGDGWVDLADLEYFAKGYGFHGDSASSVIKSVPANAAEVKADPGTAVLSGDLDALLKNEGGVTLATRYGSPISTTNPVSVTFDFAGTEGIPIEGMAIDTGNHDSVSDAQIDLIYMEEGQEVAAQIPFKEGIDFLLNYGSVQVAQNENGVITIDFGTQIAVKKVTLKIMGMHSNPNLAEISKVEFLNDMESRIPEPQMDIPQNLSAQAGNKQFTLTWDPCVNVTGYEVRITTEAEGEEKSDTVSVKGNSVQISSFQKGKLVNNTAYMVSVQSVNGAWRSGYCEPAEVVPKADKKPDAPDNLRVTGAYRAIDASWKNMEDTDSYNLYYRESGKGSFTKISGISGNRHTITGLKDRTSYEVYVTGVNELGEGKPSLTGEAETTSPDPAQMPGYKLLNRAAPGQVSEHIISAAYLNGTMQDSERDAEGAKTAWGTVDNNPVSHYLLNSWDSGGYNPLGSNGLVYEFDQPYKLQYFALQEVTVQSLGYGYAQVRYWDESGNSEAFSRSQISVQRKTDSEKRVYYMVRLPKAVTAKKIQFGLSRSLASGTVTCSEVYFYHYDSLEDDIMALYVNDLHTELKSGVTQATIDALRTRINTKDPECGEYHPDKEKLERELQTAEDILNAKLSRTVYIHNSITTQEQNRGFGGLNAWQPLGISAAAGEEITVYVGHNTKKTGENTNLQLIATQYHAESGSMFRQVANLKIGRNDITVPQLSTIKAEAGGALYVQYTGSNGSDQYAVRVSGGAEVPFLDLYQVTDRSEKLARAQKYVEELKAYTDQMEAKHDTLHKESKLSSVKREYIESECILGASDILLDTMMLSLPAAQILNGCGGSAENIVSSAEAMENMMHLFYQHKGLTKNPQKADGTPVDAKDSYPSGHLNIRYQRMFAGAFMYAAGNHIGIEWGSAPGMVTGRTLTADAEGKYQGGNYFGWGIAHEIGHCINQGSYAVAEITNNYYSVLAQARDTNDSVRFKYGQVYEKVTSGTKGRASNVFTQLGMYWQLHLAYDNGYNFKTYDPYEDQLANLFFARVDTYARTPSKAPAPCGVALSLPGDQDQNLMRLACAAAQKNLLEFFGRWGMTPNEGTVAYAQQFEPETRALCYVNDDSRVYRLTHGGSRLDAAGGTQAVEIRSVEVNGAQKNRVDLQFSSTLLQPEEILGYEIVRRTTSGGVVQEEVAGFTTANTFSDHVTTMNNRVVSYQVRVIDNYLNQSAPASSAEVKVQHDGSIDKANWTTSTNGLTAAAAAEGKPGNGTGSGTDGEPGSGLGTGSETDGEFGSGLGTDGQDTTCGPAVEDPIKNAVDGDADTAYTGTAGADAEVIMEFNKTHTVTGFKYTPQKGQKGIRDYSIFVKETNGRWKEAASGSFQHDDVQTVFFGSGRNEANDNLAGYRATAVKLAIRNQAGEEIGIAELDVLGVTGDDIDFRRAGDDKTAAIGKLTKDFAYDSEGGIIPAGSLVFTGVYKGNPAYNVVVLYDQNGNIVGGEEGDGSLNANQVILADVPDTGNIQDVSDGSWVYWIEPEHMIDLNGLEKVRAELYRVDDAQTNEGQRLVSDSKFESMPAKAMADMPEIQLTSSQGGRSE